VKLVLTSVLFVTLLRVIVGVGLGILHTAYQILLLRLV